MEEEIYSEKDYEQLELFLHRATSVAHGSPDQYQFHQNELNKCIAEFLLRPYRRKKLLKPLDN